MKASWLEEGSAAHEGRRRALAQMTRELGASSSSEAQWLTVSGACMSPRIETGERVCLEIRKVYLPGDVLAFFSANGRLQVHRLLGYRPVSGEWCCVTGADRVQGSDHPVPLAQVLGRVSGIETARGEEAFAASLAERLGAAWRFFGLALRALARRIGGRA